MKIAVIDHIGNPGGGSRVARALLPAMKKLRSDLDITFFGNPYGIKREGLSDLTKAYGIKTRRLSSVKLSGKDLFNIRGSRHLITLLQRKLARPLSLCPLYLSGAVHQELESLVKGFDIAFFTWPFHLKCPHLDCPMVGIFHDYNYKYYFSGHGMVPWVADFLNHEMPDWLHRSTPIVSTAFMKTEVEKFYPEFGHKVHVVPIAPMTTISHVTPISARHIVGKLGFSTPYLLCPTNISSHKNVGPLIAALALLKKMGHDIDLVFAGSGTEIINGRACAIGLEVDFQSQDVYGLGYVSNEVIDSLIQCAAIVVNPSLYEGGNGAGFDAWSRGVPVAMSRIPPFEEHLLTHNVHAQLFDPRSPEDIALKLHAILSNPMHTDEVVQHSKQAISRFTWEYSAEKYLEVFDEALLPK